jgi:hypothetical protein
MGKAWNSGTKKPFASKLIIYRCYNDAAGLFEYFEHGEDNRRPQIARSNAEHQVCSGAARYVDVNRIVS